MNCPSALVTEAEARAYGLQSSAVLLAAIINGVSEAFEREIGRTLRVLRACASPTAPHEVPTEWYRGNGRQELHLQRWPVLEIEWIKIGGVTYTDYRADITHLLAEGRVFRFAGWPGSAISTNPLTGDPNPNYLDYNIEVAYTAGYYEIPPDLKLAALAEMRVFDVRAASGIGAIRSEKTPGGYEVVYADSKGFMQSTVLVLDRYRERF